ncbi:polysaccharide export outer membrane protein [Sulfuritortus calidifontis]|uniref:Polysaccharide export outer membrane protein n=1 Tax=Sulfuritortus calidifontis TaxID=1914471 RepID=A0A4R3JVC6_9PROT|nr:polysaccharide biosynthesis/export family protein [Sulfuritortus calidifontis]TCS71925.1 polysaccharide export outer membrane protein [Sulfuritortus calidifontis]
MNQAAAIRFLLGIALLCTSFLGLAQAQEDAAQAGNAADEKAFASTYASSYKLGAGDLISIIVFGEEDLSKQKIRLTDAGTVPYPVLGEIQIAGLTVGDLERKITEGLRGRYLVNPRVSVQIEEYRPFYINGMVFKPGGYPFQPGLTVRKAASIAGGFRERASLQKIFIIREGDPTQRPQKVDLNTAVNPGDIITVEESFF